MDRKVWQDHLIMCSRLFVEHTKIFITRNSPSSAGSTSTASSSPIVSSPMAGEDDDDDDFDYSGKNSAQLGIRTSQTLN